MHHLSTAIYNQNDRQTLTSIQVLRAVAALYVFVFHSQVPLVTPWQNVNSEVTRLTLLGWVGVDLFFVISGFVIAWACVLSRSRPESITEFAVKRFFRVVPLYWFATFLAGLLLHKYFTRVEWETFFKGLAFIPNLTEIGPWLGYPTLHLGWTLNYEIIFYFLFALCLLAGRWALLLAPISLLALVLGPQLFSNGAITLYSTEAPVYASAYASLATNPIVLEFGIGCIAAVLFHTLRGKIPRAIIALLLASAVVTYAYCIFALPIARHGVISVGLPSAFLLIGLLLSEDAGLIRFPKWAVELGTVSYSMYLFHPFVNKICGGLSRYSANSLAIGIITCIVQTTLLILLARFIHKRFELPMMELARKLLHRRKPSSQANQLLAKQL